MREVGVCMAAMPAVVCFWLFDTMQRLTTPGCEVVSSVFYREYKQNKCT